MSILIFRRSPARPFWPTAPALGVTIGHRRQEMVQLERHLRLGEGRRAMAARPAPRSVAGQELAVAISIVFLPSLSLIVLRLVRAAPAH